MSKILHIFIKVVSFCLDIQTPEELEDDSDFEQEDYDVRSRTSVQTEDDQLIAGQSARVSGLSDLQFSAKGLCFPKWLRKILKSRIWNSGDLMSQDIVLSNGIVGSNSHVTQ